MNEFNVIKIPHLFMWFSNQNKIGADNFPLPLGDNINYYETLKNECGKIPNTPVYFCYMGRMLSDKQKASLENMSAEIKNLFVLDYDGIEKNLCESNNELGSRLKDMLSCAVLDNDRFINNGKIRYSSDCNCKYTLEIDYFEHIRKIIDLCKFMLINKPSVIKKHLEEKYCGNEVKMGFISNNNINEGIIYRDFDRVLEGSLQDLSDIITSETKFLTGSNRLRILDKDNIIDKTNEFVAMDFENMSEPDWWSEYVFFNDHVDGMQHSELYINGICEELGCTPADFKSKETKKKLQQQMLEKKISPLIDLTCFLERNAEYKNNISKDIWNRDNVLLGIKAPFGCLDVDSGMIYVDEENNNIIANVLEEIGRVSSIFRLKDYIFSQTIKRIKGIENINNTDLIRSAHALDNIFTHSRYASCDGGEQCKQPLLSELGSEIGAPVASSDIVGCQQVALS